MARVLGLSNRHSTRDILHSAFFILHSAFTLIELLVVIAILSLLMALLAPALKSARESAKQVACVSNLRQIGMAAFAYANDNDGRIPPLQEASYAASLFHGRLQPYLGRKVYSPSFIYLETGHVPSLWRCPGDKRPRKLDPGTDAWHWVYDASYALNMYALGCTDPAAPGYPYRGIALADPPNPGGFLMMTERGSNTPYNPADYTHRVYRVDGVEGMTFDRHHRLANILYLDGHVEAKDQAALTPAVEADYNTKPPWYWHWDWP